jgi:hypothetical protein
MTDRLKELEKVVFQVSKDNKDEPEDGMFNESSQQ